MEITSLSTRESFFDEEDAWGYLQHDNKIILRSESIYLMFNHAVI